MIKRAFPVLALSVFSAMLGTGIISPLMPIYAEELGATGIWIGVILGAYSFSRALLMPFVGRFSDQRGRKLVLSIGLLFFALMSLGYIWVGSVAQLTIVRLVHGVGSAMIIPIAKAYVGDLAPKGKEGTWMGYFNTSFFAGFGLGPLMGGVLTEQFGITYAFAAMGGLSFVSFLSVLLFLPEMRMDKSVDRPRPSFRMMSTSPMFRGIVSLQLFEGIGKTGFFAFIPIFAGLNLQLNSSQIGIMLTVYVLIAALLQAPFGKITDKLDRRKVILVGSSISLVTIAMTPVSQNLWHLITISVLAGTAAAIVTPASSALSVAEGRRFGMASVMSMTSLAISMGMTLGPLLAGFIAEFAGVTTVFYFAAGSSLIALMLFGWFTRVTINMPKSTA